MTTMNDTIGLSTTRSSSEDDEIFSSDDDIESEPVFCYFNISGEIFKTRHHTLECFPDTLLGSEDKKYYYDPDRDQYTFHRDRQSFHSILYYYQSGGVLRRPPNVSEEVFHKEVSFYRIKSSLGCNGRMQSTNPKLKGLKRILSQKPTEFMHYKKLLRIQIIDLMVTIVFVIAVISEQLIQGSGKLSTPKERLQALSGRWRDINTSLKVIVGLETLCTLWITTFLIMRFYWSENRTKFAKSFMAIMDAFVVLSYFITLILFELETYLEKRANETGNTVDQNRFFTIFRAMAILRMIKLFRMVHVFNLARYNALFFSLGMAVKDSLSDLFVILLFIFFCVVTYATVLFWIEFDFNAGNKEKGKFDSVFSSMWWSLITITTVGYGDMVPTTVAGKIVGALCACSGVPLIAIPLPIISQKFDVYYRRYCKRMEKRSSRKESQRLGSKWQNYLNTPFFDTHQFMEDMIRDAGPKWKTAAETNTAV